MAGLVMKPKVREVASDWADLIADLTSNAKAKDGAQGTAQLGPYDTHESVIKRLVYEFVRAQRASSRMSALEEFLDDLRVAPTLHGRGRRPNPQLKPQIRRRRTSFASNPFHCVLCQLPEKLVMFAPPDRNRVAKQLLYADRHEIDSALLVGFLAQSGTIKEIARKADDPALRERWFEDRQAAQKAAETKKSRYPLGILFISFVSIEEKAIPIEVGFAKAQSFTGRISFYSQVVMPQDEWIADFGQKWIDNGYSKSVMDLRELRNGDRPINLIEKLFEMFDGVEIVHCENIRETSHLMDLILSSALQKANFQLRDVGDFLDHDANRRASLRRAWSPAPVKLGSAGMNAATLCAALRRVAKR